MNNQSLDDLIEKISNASDWWSHPGGDILLSAHSANVSMGEFADPLDNSLAGMTLSQWQFERTKRIVLAALNEYIKVREQ